MLVAWYCRGLVGGLHPRTGHTGTFHSCGSNVLRPGRGAWRAAVPSCGAGGVLPSRGVLPAQRRAGGALLRSLRTTALDVRWAPRPGLEGLYCVTPAPFTREHAD